MNNPTPDDYGASGHGDEAPAVRAWAMDCVAQRLTGHLPRLYGLGTPVTLPQDFTAFGNGAESGFAPTADAPDVTLLAVQSGSHLSDMAFDAGALKTGAADMVTLTGATSSQLERFEFRNDRRLAPSGRPTGLMLAISGSRHELVDVRFDHVIRGIWDGGDGTSYSRPVFRNTIASPFTIAGSRIVIEDLDAEDIGENVLMASGANQDCRLSRARIRRVRRDPIIGDNGTALELWGERWLVEDLDAANVDWSIITAFDPVDLTLRGLDLRNPGQCSYPETGNDSSACINLYMLAPNAKPSNIVVRDYLLIDNVGHANAVKIMGAPESAQISDLYFVDGSMPGTWKDGKAIDVRTATTGGVTRSVCGARCYRGDVPLA